MNSFLPLESGALPAVAAGPNASEMQRSTARALGVQVPAALTFVTGVLNIWSAITPVSNRRMDLVYEVLPFYGRHHGAFTAAILGLALLLLSQNLWRRKQVAWGLAFTALLFSIPIHLSRGLNWREASLALVVSLWLWNSRREFWARSDAPSVRQGILALAFAGIGTIGYGTAGFYLLDNQFRVNFDLWDSIHQTLLMFWEFTPARLEPMTKHGAWFADSIYGVAILTFSYAAWMLARPVLTKSTLATAEESARAKSIVEAHGDTALAFCALLPDKRYWFSPGGSVVAYALVGRVAVAMGDPTGPIEDRQAAISEFTAFCRRNDWRAAFYEVSGARAPHYRAAGLECLRIAHEAVVDVRNWSTAGKAGKDFRNIANVFARLEHTARFHEAPLSDELLAELREVSDEWLAARNGSEKAFSLGWFDEDIIRHTPIMAVHNAQGRVVAFATIMSCYQLNEATVDLMRRGSEAPKCTMEFLFVNLIEWAKSHGYDTFSLGPSPFAGIGEEETDPAMERAMHLIYEHVNGYYNFKGLHAFKEKFRPSWRPLCLAWDGRAGLPMVAAAIIRADSGQDTWFDFIKTIRGGEK